MKTKLKMAQIEILVGEVREEEYVQRHIQVHLSPEQAKALRSIVCGLEDQPAKLENGRFASTGPDAIRLLLEKIGEELR